MTHRITELRTRAGLSIEELAAKADIDPDRLRVQETGKRGINGWDTYKLAEALGVPDWTLWRKPLIEALDADDQAAVREDAKLLADLERIDERVQHRLGDVAMAAILPDYIPDEDHRRHCRKFHEIAD